VSWRGGWLVSRNWLALGRGGLARKVAWRICLTRSVLRHEADRVECSVGWGYLAKLSRL
jgi:hypothetical protein